MAIHNFNCILDPKLASLGVKTCFVIVVHGRVKNRYPRGSHAAARQADIPTVKDKSNNT